MDPIRKITKKFTKKLGSKVINRQYFHRKTGPKRCYFYSQALCWRNQKYFCFVSIYFPFSIGDFLPSIIMVTDLGISLISQASVGEKFLIKNMEDLVRYYVRHWAYVCSIIVFQMAVI